MVDTRLIPLTVTPEGGATIEVDFTSASVYTSAAGTTAVVFPDEINSATTYYVQDTDRTGEIIISLNGVEIRRDRVLTLFGGRVGTLNVTIETLDLSELGGVGSSATPIVHRWAYDGVTGWTRGQISPDDNHPGSTLTVASGRGRVSSTDPDDGNHRDWWLRDSTEWADSDICSLWWGPSSLADAVSKPQGGHVHRATFDGTHWRAFTVTNNISFSTYDTLNLKIWRTDGTTLDLGSTGAQMVAMPIKRIPNIRNVSRVFFGVGVNTYWVDNVYELVNGDVVTVNATADNTFDETAAVITGVNVGQRTIALADAATTTAVAQKFEEGTVTPVNESVHKRLFPWWLRSQLVGTVMRAKVWRYGDQEPDWGQVANVVSFDGAGDTVGVPTGPGLCGIVANHLAADEYFDYGDVTFTRL